MHIREIDRRIAPLHEIIVGIGAGLAAIHERLNIEEGSTESVRVSTQNH